MSKQATLTSYFSVRKRTADVQPAKRRKIDVPEAIREDVKEDYAITATLDDHHFSRKVTEDTESKTTERISLQTIESKTPSFKSISNEESKKNRKRDSFGEEKRSLATKTPVQTEKASENAAGSIVSLHSARKKLDLDGEKKGIKDSSVATVVPFQKLGKLSPCKTRSATSGAKKIPMEKVALQSPVKAPIENTEAIKKPTVEKLKAVRNLNDLKAMLQSKHSLQIRPELSPKKVDKPPKLSCDNVSLDICVKSPSKVFKSPMKAQKHVELASPRKLRPDENLLGLRQPSEGLSLPKKYLSIANFFMHLDNIIAQKQSLSLTEALDCMKRVMRQNFNEDIMKKVKTVFPSAYTYEYEPIRTRNFAKKEEFQLRLRPNFSYKNQAGPESQLTKLGAKELIERHKIFKGRLLQIVEEHHEKFLKSRGINLDGRAVKRWHEEFVPDSECPDLEPSEFPPPPEVKRDTATDLLNAYKQQQEQRMQKYRVLFEEKQEKMQKTKETTSDSQTEQPQPIRKELKGISRELIAKIQAKEKAAAIKKMMDEDDSRNEKKLFSELKSFVPTLLNQYKQQCEKQGRVAVPANGFFVTLSTASKKSVKDVEKLCRALVKKLPSTFKFVIVRKVEFFRQCDNKPMFATVLTQQLEDLEKKM